MQILERIKTWVRRHLRQNLRAALFRARLYGLMPERPWRQSGPDYLWGRLPPPAIRNFRIVALAQPRKLYYRRLQRGRKFQPFINLGLL